MIHFHHVYKTYAGPIHALKNVNIDIEKGDFVFITGPSGAGKTTLFKLLSAHDKPTSGKIQVANYRLDEISAKEVPFFRRKIGMVFQDFKLLKDYSLLENVELPLKILGLKSSISKNRVLEILDLVGLKDRHDYFPEQISGGEKQRVAIARALIHQPDILIADEPTGNLDPKLSNEIMDLFERINKQGTTLFVATHDHEIVKRKDKKHVIIKDGMLVET
ncbi:MAG: cell division ATP-binding protein FtsE [Bdellovibrionota bacterium]